MTLDPSQAADYLSRYVEAYRQEYRRLIEPPPAGGGYPSLEISPYLYAEELLCIISADGVAIIEQSREPAGQWWIAGGPALMADFPDSRTPSEVVEFLRQEGVWGKPIGIYRLVADGGVPDQVWQGEVGPVLEEVRSVAGGVRLVIKRVDLDRLEVLQRLSFGTLGLIIDIHLAGPETDFWFPHVVRRLGFLTADRLRHRFVNYLELSPHTDSAAWDARNITTRVQADVRRDFGWAFTLPEQHGGSLSFGVGQNWVQPYYDRLSRLGDAIEAFAALLESQGNEDESVFHNFLLANPILLDVYGEAVSKPRFVYPDRETPLGKSYVEPDFVIRYPGESYRLVELEKPSRRIATKDGQPRSEVTHATFQIAEWKAYIANHYDQIKAIFPGIAVNHTAMVVMSRSSATSFGVGRDEARYRELLRSQYPGIEILTYDDLLERARQAYARVASLGISAESKRA